MKKIYYLILLIGSSIFSQSSNTTGIIRDSQTLEPISYVNIYTESELDTNTTGTISNENGEFVLAKVKSKVLFSHLNYESATLDQNANFKEILLTPKNYILDEIVVSKEKPKEYLKRIMGLSNAKIQKNTLLKSYCREIVKVNQKYTKFSDALVNYYVRKGNGKSTLVLEQNRALKSKELVEDENGVEDMNSGFDVGKYVSSAYNFESIEKMLKGTDYDFERKIRKDSKGEEYEYIEIIPNEESEKLLNTGYIIIDPKTNSILEFKIYSAESHLKNAKTINLLIAKAKINNVLVWSKFKNINNQYILTYNKKQINMYVKMGKRISDTFDFTSDLFVYEFKNNVQIPDKGYTKKTLFQAGTNFTQKFWESYNAFPLSAKEQAFINSIQE